MFRAPGGMQHFCSADFRTHVYVCVYRRSHRSYLRPQYGLVSSHLYNRCIHADAFLPTPPTSHAHGKPFVLFMLHLCAACFYCICGVVIFWRSSLVWDWARSSPRSGALFPMRKANESSAQD